jgi:16S rRNA processing protein RimM
VDAPDDALVGRVVRPQGHRGEVVVAPETDRPEERFRSGVTVAARQAGRRRPLVVRESREYRGRWIVGFEGVVSIDDAEALRGAELVVPASDLPALEAGRYYLHDLVGCGVETTAGARIGTVVRVERETGSPLLVVATARGEAMVPFVEPICRRVDVVGKRIVVEPPEGLLEL